MAKENRLAPRIAELPPRAVNAINRGFKVAASLSRAQQDQVVAEIVKVFKASGPNVTLKSVMAVVDLPEREAGDIASAVSSLIALLTTPLGSAEDYIEAGRGKLFDKSEETTVAELAGLVLRYREELNTSLERASLANATLPSMTSFDLTVDVRPRFEGDQIADVVAVGLLFIDTDAEPHIWLQLTRSDIESMRETLDRAQKQMDLAETLFRTATAGQK